jgi:hypothetical protein
MGAAGYARVRELYSHQRFQENLRRILEEGRAS